jgi:MYXO-CTERM domain-containing protein
VSTAGSAPNGGPPGADGGCSCRITSRGSSRLALGGISLLALALLRRRGRRSR